MSKADKWDIKPTDFSFNYQPSGIVSAAFHKDNSFFRGLMGPIGSGKSVSCCVEIFVRGSQRPVGKSGLRKSRWVVIRNTSPQLRDTTIKTWLDWFPEEIFGDMNRQPPFFHTVRVSDIQIEVIFLALDRPEDEKKLMSLEVTGVWFNEARYISKEIVDAATGRVGRYPPMKDKPDGMTREEWLPWYGIIADTNPCDDSHWWYDMAEKSNPEGYKFFKQPSGFSPEAENIENLPPEYYKKQLAAKTPEWIKVMLEGQYGFIQMGQPVYGDNFNDKLHVSEEKITVIPNTTIYAGIDFGLTPCCVFAQRTPDGQWQVFAEMVTPKDDTISLPHFATILKSYIDNNLSGHRLIIYGDPSGGFRDQQGMTAFDIFRNKSIAIQPAPTNHFTPRKDAVIQPLMRLINGKPGFLLDRSCSALRRGFNGKYHYRRLQVSGDSKFTLEPDKNEYSHPHDALQYLMCGGGEYRKLKADQSNNLGKVYTAKPWKIF
jgi:hypothetical protein